jgi:hypothetical protein
VNLLECGHAHEIVAGYYYVYHGLGSACAELSVGAEWKIPLRRRADLGPDSGAALQLSD